MLKRTSFYAFIMYIYIYIYIFIFLWQLPHHLPKTFRLFQGPHSLLFRMYPGSFPGVKRPSLEVNHLLASGVEVKNEWSCATTPPVCIYGVDRGIDGVSPYLNIRNAEYCYFVVIKM